MRLIAPKPGKYVVAVSGGVDSVTLLHALCQLPALDLVVAHFDHGIRPDSAEDREFVKGLAEHYDLPFESGAGELGPKASEAAAREARYAFLQKTSASHGAGAIITAHHQDDLIETAIINLLRGTHRKGLSSLASRKGLERPLLQSSKQEIITYAKQNGLAWHDDPTNNDTAYLRNYIRHELLPRFDNANRAQFVKIILEAGDINQELDGLLAGIVAGSENGTLNRAWFSQLPHGVAMEVMATWLRNYGVGDFDRKSLERLVIAAKTSQPGSRHNVLKKIDLCVDSKRLALTRSER